MKIFQLIQAKQYRGAEIFCCQFSNHLLELGHEVLIVSIYGGSAVLPFKREVISLNRPKDIRFIDVIGWKKLARIVADFKPDIIQANAADTLTYVIFSKLIFRWNVPVVYRNASSSSFYIKSVFSKVFTHFLLTNVQLIISVSESSRTDLNLLFPFTTSKTVVIPVGIEKQKINSEKYEYNTKNFNIIHIGSFTREKNHQELIDIFKILLKKSNSFTLHLIGDGKLKNGLEQRIKSENLQEKVYFQGGVKNPLAYIRAADILVLPSIVEGLPGVLLEAMYCKTPVVAYDVGGISEIILSDTGTLIEKGDQLSFAEAIYNASKNLDNDRIEKAHNQVLEKFLNAELAKSFLNYYKELVKNGGKGFPRKASSKGYN